MNPADAEEFSIPANEKVFVISRRGKVTATAFITNTVQLPFDRSASFSDLRNHCRLFYQESEKNVQFENQRTKTTSASSLLENSERLEVVYCSARCSSNVAVPFNRFVLGVAGKHRFLPSCATLGNGVDSQSLHGGFRCRTGHFRSVM